MPSLPSTPDPAAGETAKLAREDAGYHHDLHNRQMQMIAIGGAIGTGLFMGAGARLAHAGPGLFLIYGICGAFVFLILRALGELVLHRPASGSFVSYAREFFGEKAAFVAGWMYFLNWAMAAMVDSTAIASYFHYWTAFQAVPQWTLALIALVGVVSVNLISVKAFGEFEFWAALIKVAGPDDFPGRRNRLFGRPVQGRGKDHRAQPLGRPRRIHADRLGAAGARHLGGDIRLRRSRIGRHRGRGDCRAGEGDAARDQLGDRPHRGLLLRVGPFAGAAVALHQPIKNTRARSSRSSPKSVSAAPGSLMNVVVLTAAFSSLNAGLYSTGRVLRSMSVNGSGPKFTGRMSKNGVPYGGILLTATIGLFGVVLNAVKPSQAFEIVLNIAAVGVLAAWATIVLCQLRFYSRVKAGTMQRPDFRMPLAPYSGYVTLAFLAGVLVLMMLDPEKGPWVIAALVAAVPALIGGWFLVRGGCWPRPTKLLDHVIDVPDLASE